MANQWDNINLLKFAQIRAVFADEKKDGTDRMVALAAILEGTDEETISRMPLQEVQPVFARAWALNTPPQRNRVRRRYNVGAWTLRVTQPKELNVAQWLDFQNYMRGGVEENMANLLSVALIPEGKSYNDGYNIEELKAALRQDLAITDALAVCFFFQKRYLHSMRSILNRLVGWIALARIKDRKAKRAAIAKALKTKAEISALMRSL